MGNTDCYAKASLPVAVKLVASEIVVPARNAVQLAHHAGFAVLVDGGLALLGGGELKAGAEHINAGQTEAAVGAHGLAESGGLALQSRFFHHMTCEHQTMLFAPVTALVSKCLGKALTNVVMIMVTNCGNLSVREFPQQLWQTFKNIFCHIIIRIISPSSLISKISKT